MKPTLLVLAAGMGSRYGGLKQIDPIGPSGETIIDYSIYDAIRAGYGKIVFIIRKSFEDDFKRIYINKLKGIIQTECVFQELENVPQCFKIPAERVKPWGTGHAVLMAKDVISEPFTVINGDDFYGQSAFENMAIYLNSLSDSQQRCFSLMGYKVGNTLSENGSVSRGVCELNTQSHLITVTERTNIQRVNETILFYDENNTAITLQPDTYVSMNFWGFTPEYFKLTESLFEQFLETSGNQLKSEFYIPYAIDKLIQQKIITVEVLKSDAQWFGVTYQEDKPIVKQKLEALISAGIYPEKLF